jgi:hypothetical protein
VDEEWSWIRIQLQHTKEKRKTGSEQIMRTDVPSTVFPFLSGASTVFSMKKRALRPEFLFPTPPKTEKESQ